MTINQLSQLSKLIDISDQRELSERQELYYQLLASLYREDYPNERLSAVGEVIEELLEPRADEGFWEKVDLEWSLRRGQ